MHPLPLCLVQISRVTCRMGVLRVFDLQLITNLLNYQIAKKLL